MRRDEIIEALLGFIAEEILEGEGGDLDEATPLLEWGVLDSLSMVELLRFMESRFAISVPDEEVRPEHFVNVRALGDLVARLGAPAPDDEPAERRYEHVLGLSG